MSKDPQITPHDFSEVIQDLRDEMSRDVHKLTQSVERQSVSRRSVLSLTVLMSLLGGVVVGAAGISLYDPRVEREGEIKQTPSVAADVRTALKPYTQKLEQVASSLQKAEESSTSDLQAHGLLLNNLADRIDALQEASGVRHASFQEQISLLSDDLASNAAQITKAGKEPVIAARPTLSEKVESAVQPALALSELSDDREQERGKLAINNPSSYELQLLVNGTPVDIRPRGVTTIDVTVGKVKTQFANIPEIVQFWEKWQSVDGTKQMSIQVDSGGGYYRLK